jgi:hypothetical protein
MEEKFLEEQKHKEFIEKENFGVNLFSNKSRLLKIIIAPNILIPNRVDYQKNREWLKNNPYPHINQPWNPSLNGVRTIGRFTEIIKNTAEQEVGLKETAISVVLLFHNAIVSYCCELDTRRGEKEEIHLRWITNEITEILDYTSKFYKQINFSEPVKIYIQLINIKGLPANLNVDTFFRNDWDFLSPKFEKQWNEENLIFNIDSSGKEIIEIPREVARKVSNRLVQVFGIWELPYFKEK